MKIYGVLVVYNDYPHIVDTIESMLPHVDEIVAVDGKYSDFPGVADGSTDETVQYLSGIDKVRIVEGYGLQEVEKRNLYLVGEVGDWYFHLDADEIWRGRFPQLPLEEDMAICRLHQLRSGHMNGERIRIFRHVEGLHYEGKHYWLRDNKGNTFALLDKPGDNYRIKRIDGHIEHHDGDRNQTRQNNKRKYYRSLVKRENPIREVT